MTYIITHTYMKLVWEICGEFHSVFDQARYNMSYTCHTQHLKLMPAEVGYSQYWLLVAT